MSPVLSARPSGEIEETFAPVLWNVTDAPARAGTSAKPYAGRAAPLADCPGDSGECPLVFVEIAGSSIWQGE
jgi:hypothetical protein